MTKENRSKNIYRKGGMGPLAQLHTSVNCESDKRKKTADFGGYSDTGLTSPVGGNGGIEDPRSEILRAQARERREKSRLKLEFKKERQKARQEQEEERKKGLTAEALEKERLEDEEAYRRAYENCMSKFVRIGKRPVEEEEAERLVKLKAQLFEEIQRVRGLIIREVVYKKYEELVALDRWERLKIDVRRVRELGVEARGEASELGVETVVEGIIANEYFGRGNRRVEVFKDVVDSLVNREKEISKSKKTSDEILRELAAEVSSQGVVGMEG